MTNQDFTRHMAHIARRASDWTHDSLTGGYVLTAEADRDTRARFCESIREILKQIETR